jgi:hypothetical protein
VEVTMVRVPGHRAVCLRDLTTGILYGGGGTFRDATSDETSTVTGKDFRFVCPS